MIRDEDVHYGDLFEWGSGGIYMFITWPREAILSDDGRSWTALIVENVGRLNWKPVIQSQTVGFQARRSGDGGWERVG